MYALDTGGGDGDLVQHGGGGAHALDAGGGDGDQVLHQGRLQMRDGDKCSGVENGGKSFNCE